MKTLSGLDGGFLSLETPETPMHVGSLQTFEVPKGQESRFYVGLKESVRERLPKVPAFSRRLAPMPLQFANPVWIHEDRVDLDYHVQRIHLPEPGTHEQLFKLVAGLHAELLDRAHPLWRIYVVDGLQGDEVGYYIKVHHAVIDGQAGMALAELLFDSEPQASRPRRGTAGAAPPGARPHAAERPGAGQLVAAAFRHDAAQVAKLLRSLPDVARTLSGLMKASGAKPPVAPAKAESRIALAPRTPLNVTIGTERDFAAVSIPLAEVKRIAAASEAKVNDVVLATCSGALRRYLARHGELPRKSLMAAMPVSLRAAGNKEFTTQATMALVSLASDIAHPLRRLRAIRDAAGRVKSTVGRAKSVIPTDFPTIGVPWVMHALATLYGRSHIADVLPPVANVVISNVPGPQFPLYAVGARMTGYWPLSIVEHGVGLNITLISYDGAVGYGLLAARNAMPDVAVLAEEIRAAHEELMKATRPKASVKRGAAGPRHPSKAGPTRTRGASRAVK